MRNLLLVIAAGCFALFPMVVGLGMAQPELLSMVAGAVCPRGTVLSTGSVALAPYVAPNLAAPLPVECVDPDGHLVVDATPRVGLLAASLPASGIVLTAMAAALTSPAPRRIVRRRQPAAPAVAHTLAPAHGLPDIILPPPPRTLKDRLTELEAAYDDKLITKVEYEVKRQAVLDAV